MTENKPKSALESSSSSEGSSSTISEVVTNAASSSSSSSSSSSAEDVRTQIQKAIELIETKGQERALFYKNCNSLSDILDSHKEEVRDDLKDKLINSAQKISEAQDHDRAMKLSSVILKFWPYNEAAVNKFDVYLSNCTESMSQLFQLSSSDKLSERFLDSIKDIHIDLSLSGHHTQASNTIKLILNVSPSDPFFNAILKYNEAQKTFNDSSAEPESYEPESSEAVSNRVKNVVSDLLNSHTLLREVVGAESNQRYKAYLVHPEKLDFALVNFSLNHSCNFWLQVFENIFMKHSYFHSKTADKK